MRVYHNLPSAEFIALLRERAIQAGLGPLFIDAVDKLNYINTRDEEIVALREEIIELESAITELQNELAACTSP